MNFEPTRRDFLRTTTLAAASAALAPALFAADAKKKIPIAVQLYSVRNELKDDFKGVIEQIGKMGYQGVEFASLQERTQKPKELRKLLDDNGLKACGTHTPINTLQGDALKATVDLHQELGNRFLICPSLQIKDAAGWLAQAKHFNEIAARLKEYGMFTGYHSHQQDFKQHDGKTAWEIFFDNTNAEVIHQLDTGNTLQGGGDPLALIKKYAGRTKSTHIKEYGGPKGAAIGEGTIDWKTYLDTYESVAGVEWYIVEHETGAEPLKSIKTCIENLHKFGR